MSPIYLWLIDALLVRSGLSSTQFFYGVLQELLGIVKSFDYGFDDILKSTASLVWIIGVL